MELAQETVDLAGGPVTIERGGTGPTLVMLHGGGGLRVSPLHLDLADRFEVIAFQLPGFGGTVRHDDVADTRDMARVVSQSLRQLGVERYSVLGESFGGKVATWLAIDDGEHIDAVVLESPATFRSEPLGSIPPEEIPGRMFAHPERLAGLFPPPGGDGPGGPPTDDAGPYGPDDQRLWLDELMGHSGGDDVLPHLGSIQPPVLALFGTEDGMVDPETGRIYRREVPNCHYALLYDAGHLLHLERPEAFLEIVLDFLARKGGFVAEATSGVLYP